MHHLLLALYDQAGLLHPLQPPNPPPAVPPGLEKVTGTVLGWLKWGVLSAGVAGLLICAGMIVVGRRNRNQFAADGVIGGMWVLGGLAMASAAAAIVGAFTL